MESASSLSFKLHLESASMHAKIRLTAVVQASVNNLALTLGLYDKCVTLIFFSL